MAEPALTTARKAAYCLNEIVKQLGLGNLARWFDSDDPEVFLVVNEQEVRVVMHEQLVAFVELGDECTVSVWDCEQLVRSAHMQEFHPEDYGIVVQTARDWKGDKIKPDLLATITPDYPPFTGPRNPIPKTTHRRRFRVKSSL